MAEDNRVQVLLHAVRGESKYDQENSLRTLGMMLNDDNVVATIRKEGMSTLVQALDSGHPKVQEHAAAVIWTLASFGHQDCALQTCALGGVRKLVRLAQEADPDTQEYCAAALWALGLESTVQQEVQQEMLTSGGVPAMVSLLESGTEGAKENAAGALWNLSLTLDHCSAIAEAGAIPLLITGMEATSTEMQENACGAIRNLALLAANRRVILEGGGLDRLLARLCDGTPTVKSHAAAALAHLRGDAQCAACLAGHLEELEALAAQAVVGGDKLVATHQGGALTRPVQCKNVAFVRRRRIKQSCILALTTGVMLLVAHRLMRTFTRA